MELVLDRTAATLLPIIQRHTQPSTTIHSDEWAAYNNIQSLPSVSRHETVYHSIEFVSACEVHNQNVESYWARAKLKLKIMKGVAADQLPSYIDEFMWRERLGNRTSEALDNIIIHIAAIYSV